MTVSDDAAIQRLDRPRVKLVLLVVATLLAAGTAALTWFVAVPIGPEVCGLVYPPARNCFTTDRVANATTVSVILVVVYVATAVSILLGRRGRWLVIVGLAMLVVAPIWAYVTAAWIPALA